ncbi:MAG TPA: AAA family ATPase [Thermoanaerobaculia bacterium]|nr:AAA family ATPase [Thermoanaerobaculia bacterium]
MERETLARQGQREGREIRFLCPAHLDTRPSARWHPEKRTWFCDACKAGGGWRDLARRLGLNGSEARAAGGGEIVASYPYCGADGRVLYEVVRTIPKGFACRRPDGAGGWVWNLRGTERVLYRLPEVLAAVRTGERIWVVEGEKDADALAALGFAATTNPGGAGKWRAEYGAALRGARVVVVPDNDAAGREHAAAVARGLEAVGCEVRVVELGGLAAKGDVSDWLDRERRAGKADESLAGELEALAGAAPVREVGRRPAETAALRSRQMSKVKIEKVSFLWRPYLPLGKVTLLEGDPGQGKSWVTAAIAASGSLGRGLPGAEPFEPFRSLIFTAEDGLGDTLARRLEALGADRDLVFAHDESVSLDTTEGLAELVREIEGRRPLLVIIDPVVAYLSGRTDIYRANEVRSVLAPLAKIAERYGCAILAVRHVNKAKGGRAIYAGQGSIDFTAAARSVLLAGSAAGDPQEHALLHIKSNLAASGRAYGYRIEEERFFWTGESRLTAGDLLAPEVASEELTADGEARAFLRDLLAEGPVPARRVVAAAKAAGITERTLRRAKDREGIAVTKQGFGASGQWLWSIPS